MNPQANSESPTGGSASVTTIADFGEGDVGVANRWKAELKSADKAEKNFILRAEKTIKRYRDERDAVDDQDRKFNILWSNVQTLKPAMYAKPPIPETSRRFDTTNPVNRVAAMILERNLSFTVCEHSMFDETMSEVVEDRLLPGRGVAWVRYVADFKPMYADRPSPLPAQPEAATAPPAGAPEGASDAGQAADQLPPGPLSMGGTTPMPPKTPMQPKELQNKALTDDSYEIIAGGERVCYDYVHWKDFRMSPCRTWEECSWVARRVFMTQANGIKRFGDEFKLVPLNYTETKADSQNKTGGNEQFGPGQSVLKKAAIWEIWSKEDKKVYWICEDHPKCLDEKPDLFQLDEFFPCPKPLLATTTNDSTVPIPDFCMYQDQAGELDQITNRISLLTQALKVVGLYDKTQAAIQRLLTEGVDNTMIPVDNWAMFAERGGLKGTVDFFPMQMVIETLEKLITARGVVKQDVYEITGIADIVRGASVASETATAVSIKDKFVGIRTHDTQKDIARFASDLINMTAQIMTNFFQPETLIINADMQDPSNPDYQYVQGAVQLIKDGKLIQHKITVTVDSITKADDKEQREARVEFLQGFAQLLQQAIPAVQQIPSMAPMLSHIILWSVRGFKVGRDIEGVIEQGISQMSQNGTPPPPPDPAAQKMQAEQQAHQQQMAQEQEKHQMAQKREQDALALKQAQNQEDLRHTQAANAEALNHAQAMNQAAVAAIFMKAEAAAKVTTATGAQQLDQKGVAGAQALAQAHGEHLQSLVQGSEAHAQGMAQQDQQHAAGLVQGQEKHEVGQEQAAEAGNLKLEQMESAAKAKKEGE